MDHEEQASRSDPSPTTPPKLTLNSLPSASKRGEAWAGVATPPIRLAGVVPFRWEEEPGRPKSMPGRETAAADADVRLELPPRLSASTSAKVVNPNRLTNPSCFLIRGTSSCSFGKERRGRKFACSESEKSSSPNSSASSSSSSSSSSFSSLKSYSSASVSSCYVGGEESEGEAEAEQRKVRILRCRKRRISASHLWAGIIVRLKQAVIVPHRKERDHSI